MIHPSTPGAGDRHCATCHTLMKHAPGIGQYCPDRECDSVDGPAVEDGAPAPGSPPPGAARLRIRGTGDYSLVIGDVYYWRNLAIAALETRSRFESKVAEMTSWVSRIRAVAKECSRYYMGRRIKELRDVLAERSDAPEASSPKGPQP